MVEITVIIISKLNAKNFFIRNLYNLILPSIILRKENFNYIKANQLSAGFSGLFASIVLRKKKEQARASKEPRPRRLPSNFAGSSDVTEYYSIVQ